MSDVDRALELLGIVFLIILILGFFVIVVYGSWLLANRIGDILEIGLIEKLVLWLIFLGLMGIKINTGGGKDG